MYEDPTSSLWVAAMPAWLAGIGTLIVAFVAIFNEWVKRLFFHPTLRLGVRVGRPVAEKTFWGGPMAGSLVTVYYFRLEVENVGNASAEDVQVYAASVHRVAAGETALVQRFTPMNLCWSHIRKPTLPILLPDMPPRYCDLAHITNPAAKKNLFEDLPSVNEKTPVLALDLEAKPFSGGHLLEPGEYYLVLKLAATNCPPKDYRVYVNFAGLWFDDESKMFKDGIHIREA